MYNLLKRLLNTIKYLKLRQVIYQLKNRAYTPKYKFIRHKDSIRKLILTTNLKSNTSFDNYTFRFLNLSTQLKAPVNWNYNENGKLWTYNLTYFNYLQQEKISKLQGEKLIIDFIENIENVKDGLEPYPTSLRLINWIKFVNTHNIDSSQILDSIYSQAYHLSKNLEHHLLGNHLLENGFSLLLCSYFFRDSNLYEIASKILQIELREQILEDGAHFELSPMYHSIILERLLDSYDLVLHNKFSSSNLQDLLKTTASKMLTWLKNISVGTLLPHLNDSTNGIATNHVDLIRQAEELKINHQSVILSTSGYRHYTGNKYDCLVDVGNIGPDYIPGHAHADTFNFELYIDKNPAIVDTGISTYENDRYRQYERSTSAHNTVVVNNQNSSEVWSSFRVANRAKIVSLKEDLNYICASHDGYKNIGVIHQREFITDSDKIEIKDELLGNGDTIGKAYLHFHPNIVVCIKDNIITTSSLLIAFENQQKIHLESYNYAEGFNTRKSSSVVIIEFKNYLKTTIHIAA